MGVADAPPSAAALSAGTQGQITQLLDPEMWNRFKDLDQVRWEVADPPQGFLRAPPPAPVHPFGGGTDRVWCLPSSRPALRSPVFWRHLKTH